MALIVTVLCIIGAMALAQPIGHLLTQAPFTGGVGGMMLYVLLTVLGTVVAPVSTLPLLPVAVVLWGPLATALLSSVGWTIGAFGAFVLAERFGAPLVERMVGVARMQAYRSATLPALTFWRLVLLRMLIPVDVLSYALGVGATIPRGRYTLATLIGVLPGAFLFSYAVTLPTAYQVAGGVLGVLLLFWYVRRMGVVH